jgi:hypothetical protein
MFQRSGAGRLPRRRGSGLIPDFTDKVMAAASFPFRYAARWQGAAAVVFFVLGCGASRPWALTPRPTDDPPERFLPDSAYPPLATSAATTHACVARLVDPRGGTRLMLQRSAQARGDYAVEPAGRYGVGALELLRVECGTARPIGIVPRAG